MRGSSGRLICIVVALLVPLPALGFKPKAAERAVAHLSNMEEATGTLGVPVRCVVLPRERQMCEWQYSNRDRQWRYLATAIGTSERVALLCVFERGGERVRVGGSCMGYPQRSNRDKLRGGNPGYSRSNQNRPSSDPRGIARGALRAAKDLERISQVLGATPDHCMPIGEHDQVCTWRLSSRVYGHGTVAISAGIDLSKRVVFECKLPIDGSPRLASSCVGR